MSVVERFETDGLAHLLVLGGLFEVEQASLLNGLFFDALSFEQDVLCPAEVDVGRCQIVQASVVAPMIVVLEEGVDPRFKLARKVVFQDRGNRLTALLLGSKPRGP